MQEAERAARPSSALNCVRVNVAALCSWMHKALSKFKVRDSGADYKLIININLSTDILFL